MKKKMLVIIGIAVIANQFGKLEASSLLNCCMLERSLLNLGDTTRIENVMQKALRGEKIVIGVIGGSITQGAQASTVGNRYGNIVADWWKKQFPDSQIEFINAGIGATGSAYGSFRVQNDLLKYNPDFVIVEFGVNDADTKQSAEALEGVIRQILKHPNQPAVMLLFMMKEGGLNAQYWHSKVGIHYELPMISFRDALWPEVEAKRIAWTDIMADNVHPNDIGHFCAAEFVINVLGKVLKNINSTGNIKILPDVLFADLYEYTNLHPSESINPISNNGWILTEGNWLGSWWRSNLPESIIEFEVEGGSLVAILFYRDREDMGQVKVKVDDQPDVILEGWGSQTWGAYMPMKIVAQDITPCTHRIKIELLSTNNVESNGYEFRILGIAVAGIDE